MAALAKTSKRGTETGRVAAKMPAKGILAFTASIAQQDIYFSSNYSTQAIRMPIPMQSWCWFSKVVQHMVKNLDEAIHYYQNRIKF